LIQVKFIVIIDIMNETNAADLDLNLLRVFLAIWDLRSLTAAGQRLGLTQPAISHALRRLRERYNDPLFVRATNRMLPTDTAVRLHEPLDQALGLINRTLQEQAAFDPQLTARTFRIAMSDVSETYYLPRLMAKLMRVAPLLRLDVVPLAVDQVVGAMRAGEVDLALGFLKNLEGECDSRALFDDRMICMVRAGHPLAGARLTKAGFAHLRYVHAGAAAPGHQIVEQWLADAGIRRDIAIRLGHFTVAPEIVRRTDLAVIFPESLGRQLNSGKAFRLLALPFDLPPVEIKVHRHPRFASDKGIGWLRDMLVALFATP
jgi:DNA-binding transcriptional LysR family regulator